MKVIEIKAEGVKELKELSISLSKKLFEVEDIINKIKQVELTFNISQ